MCVRMGIALPELPGKLHRREEIRGQTLSRSPFLTISCSRNIKCGLVEQNTMV